MVYDEYISLGVNCEAAFQFRRVLREVKSSFFNWNVTPVAALLSLLKSDFANIGQAENLVYENHGDLVHDRSHGYDFHWVGNDFSIVSDPESESYKENALKLRYMAEKFNSLIDPNRRIVFFYTYNQGGENLDSDLELLKSVCNVLEEKYNTTNYAFVLLLHTNLSERVAAIDLGERVFVRYMRRFAPWFDATDGHVLSWDNVFREFPHVDGLTLANY